MQISGTFSKIKMPNLMVGLCAAMLLTITPAHADTFILGQHDYQYASENPGLRCSSDGNIIIFCDCPGQNPMPNVTETCPNGIATIPSAGCKFDGNGGIGREAFCVGANTVEACYACKCEDEISSWAYIGSNRVSRTVKRAVDDSDNSVCKISPAVTEYGCAADYYTTASTPSASMTCSRCPGLTLSSGTTRYGNSSTGNTSITGCSQPANTTFKDNVGRYQFTSSCNYTK